MNTEPMKPSVKGHRPAVRKFTGLRLLESPRSGDAARQRTSMPVSFRPDCRRAAEGAVADETAVVVWLSALAQAMRLHVFRALVGAGPQGMTPSVLATLLGVPASTLSFHLKELMQAGLVSQQRDGRNLIYRPMLERMNALLGYLKAHCCGAQRCDEPSTAPGEARRSTR